MTQVLTLEQVKTNLRLDLDDPQENADLQLKIDAAVDYASQFIGRSIPWNDKDGNEVPVPASVKSAILLIIGDLYENREGQTTAALSVNPLVESMLHFYRTGLGV